MLTATSQIPFPQDGRVMRRVPGHNISQSSHRTWIPARRASPVPGFSGEIAEEGYVGHPNATELVDVEIPGDGIRVGWRRPIMVQSYAWRY